MTKDGDQTHLPTEDGSKGEASSASNSRVVSGRRTFGEFRVLRKIGEGGMGVVYEAEQPSLGRTVALKVVRAGQVVDEYRLALFQREAKALARLKHAGIAGIYGVGATEQGEHYFAMELVRGATLSHHFRGGAQEVQPVREELARRLRVFRRICDAVNYAHQRGVIHRDLKPSNILVTEGASASTLGSSDTSSAVKILDFGLARITDADLAATQITETGRIQGTFSYMSPEQARANPDEIDLRTDVYSLGVVLYELITGRLPQDMSGCSVLEAARLVEETEAVPPSRVWAESGAPIKLDRDLETIVLKALEKEPGNRYQNALAVGEDIDRYLANQPILAAPPSLGYQLRKLVARHKVPVASAAALLVLLVGFAVTVSFQSARIARERTAAVTAREDADRLISFMIEDLREKLEEVGRLDILDGVGDEALEYFGSLPQDELDDEDRLRLATTLRQIGEVRVDQGQLPAALEAFERARALAEELVAGNPDNGAWQEELGQSLFWVGYIHWERGDLDAAIGPFEGYLEVAERLAADDPENPDLQLEVAYANNNLAFMLREKGDLDGALAKYEMVMAMVETLSANDPTNTDLRFELADVHNTLGTVRDRLGDLAAAEEHHRIDLGMKQELVSADPENLEWRLYLGISHNLLAQIQGARDDIEGSLANYRAAALVHGELVEHDPANTAWRRELAVDHSGAGRQLLILGDLGAAAESLQTALQIMQALVTGDPTNPGWQRDLASIRRGLGRLHLLRGDTGGALREAETALGPLRELLKANPDDRSSRRQMARVHLLTGGAHAAGGNPEAAAAAFEAAAETIEPLARSSDDRRALVPWAEALLHLDRVAEATPTVDKLLAMGYRHRDFLALCRSKGLSVQ